jgi:hypothetical protein
MTTLLTLDVSLTPYMIQPEEYITLDEGSTRFDQAASAMADECDLFHYEGTLYNMPARHGLQPPFYCVTRGRYVGVFPSYIWSVSSHQHFWYLSSEPGMKLRKKLTLAVMPYFSLSSHFMMESMRSGRQYDAG